MTPRQRVSVLILVLCIMLAAFDLGIDDYWGLLPCASGALSSGHYLVTSRRR